MQMKFTAYARPEPQQRFFSRVDKNGPVVRDGLSPCWIWTGSKDRHGYGWFWMDGKSLSAHRAAWMILKGDIPAGMMVCHVCDCRTCVNGEHLFLGTALDNSQDAKRKGRTLCGAKHPRAVFTEQMAREIRSKHAPRKTASLAREYGVSDSAIRAVVTGKTGYV